MDFLPNNKLSGYSISVSLLRQLFKYCIRLDINPWKITDSFGIDQHIFEDPDARIPVEYYIAIEKAAIELSGDSCFGLHMGEYSESENWGVLGYMLKNSRTLGDAMAIAGKYSKIVGNLLQGSVRMGRKTFTIIMHAPNRVQDVPRHCFESAFASLVIMMRTITGKKINPVEVGFTFSKPDSVDEYKRIFQAPVFFGRKNMYITLELNLSSVPVLFPNKQLLAYFRRYADSLLSEYEGNSGFVREVSRLITERINDADFSLKLIASELAMSQRTLQKKLTAEGKDFSSLLKSLRHKMADLYLNEDYTVEEITCLLGYRDTSAFRKAYKKWSGLTPREYRLSVC